MECFDADKVRPLDELLDDTISEFDSGRDRACGRDLDRMIWELGDYENTEPPQESEGYMEDTPIEDELAEKTMIVGRRGRASFKEIPEAEESFFTGEQVATASSITPETRRRRAAAAGRAKATQQTAVARSRAPGKKKK